MHSQAANQVNQRINELISMGCLQPDDPGFQFFKQTIVPSLLFEWRTPSGLNSHSYRCPFQTCAVLVSKSQLLERHLREQHYDEIPDGVFGRKHSFTCDTCGINFKRYEHLRRHNEGRKHLKILVSKGLATKEEKDRWRAICYAEREHKQTQAAKNNSNSQTQIGIDLQTKETTSDVNDNDDTDNHNECNQQSFSTISTTISTPSSSYNSQSYNFSTPSSPFTYSQQSLSSISSSFSFSTSLSSRCSSFSSSTPSFSKSTPLKHIPNESFSVNTSTISLLSNEKSPTNFHKRIDLSEDEDSDEIFHDPNFIDMINRIEERSLQKKKQYQKQISDYEFQMHTFKNETKIEEVVEFKQKKIKRKYDDILDYNNQENVVVVINEKENENRFRNKVDLNDSIEILLSFRRELPDKRLKEEEEEENDQEAEIKEEY